MTKVRDNRRSFRIIESALLKYDVIDDVEFSQGLTAWKIRQGAPSSIRSKILDMDARFDTLLYRVKLDVPAAASAIELLNDKLNVVLEALPEFRQSREALANQPPQLCELSAEGMVFGSNEMLAPQTKLRMRFLVISDNRFFETFCRVIRTVDATNAEDRPHKYSVAIEFYWTNSAERETLIQHLFSKQSQTLRLRRKQSEDDT